MPKSGSLSELFTMLALEQPPPLSELRPELPEELVHVVHKGLAKDRGQRYQSAAEMAEALAPFSDERSDHLLSRFLKTAHGPHTRPPPASATPSAPPSALASLARTPGSLASSPASVAAPSATRTPGKQAAQTGTMLMSGAPVTTPPPARAPRRTPPPAATRPSRTAPLPRQPPSTRRARREARRWWGPWR